MEKSISQRKLRRLEWWKKKSDTGDGENVEKNASNKKRKAPTVGLDSGVSKKRKTEHKESDNNQKSSEKNKNRNEKQKRKRNDPNIDGDNSPTAPDLLPQDDKSQLTCSEKKSKKVKMSQTLIGSDTSKTPPANSSNGKREKLAKNRKGYVIFVGNLPYNITKEDVEQHFIKTGGVKDVRLLTDKMTGKSRGCAYVEFMDSKSHKFGLRLHESMLGDRKINVEFTSRGRKTPKRTERLKEKNRRMARFKRVFDRSV